MPEESVIREALASVKYPGFSRDIISFGLVKQIEVDGARVRVQMSFATRDPQIPARIYKEAREVLEALEGVEEVDLDFDIKDPPAQQPPAGQALEGARIPGVKKVVAVASGKGGVGKSTVAANLAVALAQAGHRVGLCDCDLYGPSIALMFGSEEQPMADERERIIPIRAHGLQLMSMGFLVDDQSAVIVRGPLATRYVQQFLRDVAWDDLDYLILDLPPGTGDIQLSIVQTVALDGALIVTTPQEVALIDARKAATMFAKVNVAVLGLIENMSYFQCPSDGKRYDIFGTGGGAAEAERLGVPLMGAIPIDIPTREGGDVGQPIALRDRAESEASDIFHNIAESVAERVPPGLMEFVFLDRPAPVRVELEDPFGMEVEFPLAVPLKAAEAPGDILLWHDPETHLVGMMRARQRVCWPREAMRLINVAVLHPDEGPGVVGLEVGLEGREEAPVLATTAYSAEAVEWLREQREVLSRFLGLEVGWADYGRDR